MKTITLEVTKMYYNPPNKKHWGTETLEVPLDMYLEALIYLPTELGEDGEADLLDVHGLAMNHRKRDSKGHFTK